VICFAYLLANGVVMSLVVIGDWFTVYTHCTERRKQCVIPTEQGRHTTACIEGRHLAAGNSAWKHLAPNDLQYILRTSLLPRDRDTVV